MSDYRVSRKRKRQAVDPCLGFYLLSSGNVISSPSSRSNNSPNFGFKALAACTDFHEDTAVPSSAENAHGIVDICDASHNQISEDLPGNGLQRTPECARRMSPENLGYKDLGSSSNIVSDSKQVMMTVEDFIKRTSKRNGAVKKQYGKTKTRIKRLGDEAERQSGIFVSNVGDTSQGIMQLRSKKIKRATVYASSSDESSSSPNHDSSSPAPIKRKKKRGYAQKSFKERLYEAAVLTHGHPDDILVHGGTTGSDQAPSRQPLRFIPNTQPELDDSQLDNRRPRSWSFVDPRRSMAIRTASFSSRIRPSLQHTDSISLGKSANLSVRPPKRWKFADACLAHSSLSTLKSNRQPKAPAVKAYEYPPLRFVSLKEAEEGYKSVFLNNTHQKTVRLPDVRTTTTLQMVSVAETVSQGRICKPTAPTYSMHMVPLEEVIQRPDFAIEASAQVAVDEIRTSASLNLSPIINSISSASAPVPVTPGRTQDRPNSNTSPVHHGIPRANVRGRVSMRRGSDGSPKPMRPLASFFNEFIQNIRNVAVSQDQPSVSDKHLVYKRPLRKASRNEHNPRIFVSQKARTNDLESIRQNDPSYKDHMNRQRTLDLSYNQSLSPDIAVILEPQGYQVILSSPT